MNQFLGAILASALLLVIAGICYQFALNKRMRRFFGRPCMGREWRVQFPSAKTDEIRDFLELFTDSFALSSKKKLSLSPGDRVMDIYRTIYPKEGGADALECETLVNECEARYDVDIAKSCGDNPTLGEIFRAIQKSA